MSKKECKAPQAGQDQKGLLNIDIGVWDNKVIARQRHHFMINL